MAEMMCSKNCSEDDVAALKRKFDLENAAPSKKPHVDEAAVNFNFWVSCCSALHSLMLSCSVLSERQNFGGQTLTVSDAVLSWFHLIVLRGWCVCGCR